MSVGAITSLCCVASACGQEGAVAGFSRKADHVTPAAKQTWSDVTGWESIGTMPNAAHFEIESVANTAISGKEALRIREAIQREEGTSVQSSEREKSGFASQFGPFSKYVIAFKDKSAQASKVRRSAHSAHEVTQLESAAELEALGLSLERVAYSHQTAAGWTTDWYDRSGKPVVSKPAEVPRWTGPYGFEQQGMPRMGLFFSKAKTSPVTEFVGCKLYDANTKVMLDRASGVRGFDRQAEVPLLFPSTPIFHAMQVRVVMDYRSTPVMHESISPAELGPVYDDGKGAVVALLAKGEITIMGRMAADPEVLVCKAPMMKKHFPPGFYFKTWPREMADPFTIELLASDQETIIPSSVNHQMGADGLVYCLANPADLERVKHIRVKHRKDLHRVIFPLTTSWLPPGPSSGDLFDVKIPYAKVADRRFADSFMASVAQFTSRIPNHTMRPSNMSAAPRDAVPQVYSGVTVREFFQAAAMDMRYDATNAQLSGRRRPE